MISDPIGKHESNLLHLKGLFVCVFFLITLTWLVHGCGGGGGIGIFTLLNPLTVAHHK